MTADDVQALTFEDAFRQLTEIAEGMEKGGLTLADATARYEQGMKLVQHCNHLLDTAELEITQLREGSRKPVSDAGYDDDSGSEFYFPPDDEINEYEEEDDLPFQLR